MPLMYPFCREQLGKLRGSRQIRLVGHTDVLQVTRDHDTVNAAETEDSLPNEGQGQTPCINRDVLSPVCTVPYLNPMDWGYNGLEVRGVNP